jgi:hypothetical protein
MPLAHWIAMAVLAMLPPAVAAQGKSKNVDPADSAVAVPPIAYRSAFKGDQPLSDPTESPQQLWRAANDAMSRLGGHAGHVRQEQGRTPAAQPKKEGN